MSNEGEATGQAVGEAEWAARWEDLDARERIRELAGKLEIAGKPRDFEVRFSFASEPQAPDGHRWILRRRRALDKDTRELTLKLRGEGPLGPEAWPLPEKPDSAEWDVSLTMKDKIKRSFSQSITLSERRTWRQPPAEWRVGLWSRPVLMRRIKSEKGEAVEFWTVGKRRYIEISRRGPLDDEKRFRHWVERAATPKHLLEMGMTALVTGVRG
jgi:hypothetical protein